MYLGPRLLGTVSASVTAFVYRCDHCAAEYTFDLPQTEPFRCNSGACDWSMIRIESTPPLPGDIPLTPDDIRSVAQWIFDVAGPA